MAPRKLKQGMKSASAGNPYSVLARIVDASSTLPALLRFGVIFFVLIVIVVISGRVFPLSLVPLLYVLLFLVFGFIIWRDIRSRKALPTDLSEDDWLDLVIKHLRDGQKASIYLRYFRDPDAAMDERLLGKQERIRTIMTEFSNLLLNHESDFFLVGFRKRAWPDDPKAWLVGKMMETNRLVSREQAERVVNDRIAVIHDEPQQNSSTVYLIDDRYLLFNRVSGEMGHEKKLYHAYDYDNSVVPLLITRGCRSLLTSSQSNPQ